ncbi:MAG: hypothetical protein V3U53_05420, partial [bacterium]
GIRRVNLLEGVTQKKVMDSTGQKTIAQHLAYDNTNDEDLDRQAKALSEDNRRKTAALDNPQDQPS